MAKNLKLDRSVEPEETTGAHLGRQARRRLETRARLIEAARAMFAAQGVEKTRINEITDAADLGFGSFYNHFDSKEAIVKAVLEETIKAQGAAIDAVTRGLQDPAEAVAVAHRYFVAHAASDPSWGWLLTRLADAHDATLSALGPYARRDLQRGVESGRFRVADEEVALRGSGGALLSVIGLVVERHAPAGAGSAHAEGVLRMLGLSPGDAAVVARRPMPEVSL